MGLRDDIRKVLIAAHPPGDPIVTIIEKNDTDQFVIDFIHALMDERARTFELIRALRVAVRRYGKHDDECNQNPCTCGYVAMINSVGDDT